MRISGKPNETRDALERLRSLGSVIVSDVSLYRNPEHRELLSSRLRLTMGETA